MQVKYQKGQFMQFLMHQKKLKKKLLMFNNESIFDLKYSFDFFFHSTIQRLKKLISQMIWANREMVPFIGESVTYYD